MSTGFTAENKRKIQSLVGKITPQLQGYLEHLFNQVFARIVVLNKGETKIPQTLKLI